MQPLHSAVWVVLFRLAISGRRRRTLPTMIAHTNSFSTMAIASTAAPTTSAQTPTCVRFGLFNQKQAVVLWTASIIGSCFFIRCFDSAQQPWFRLRSTTIHNTFQPSLGVCRLCAFSDRMCLCRIRRRQFRLSNSKIFLINIERKASRR